MKNIVFCASIVLAGFITACNNNKNEQASHDMNKMTNDSMPGMAMKADTSIRSVAVMFTNLDTKASASINGIVDHYLHVKNALANDNGSEAAEGAKALKKSADEFDKSLLTAEQKKVFDDVSEDLLEHAEHISKNGNDISHQREHFSKMSDDIYSLVTAFGGGRELYSDFCPMYNDNKGAHWVSEMQEVRNPYFGAAMLKCGKIEEIIK
jgi:hypothetical protein